MSLEGTVPPSGEEDSPTVLPATSEGTVASQEQQQQSSDASLLSASELPGSISTPTQPKSQTSEEPTSTGTIDDAPIDDAPSEKNWIDVLGSKQLMKRTIRVGKGVSTRPTPQSRVKVSTKGCLESGEVVDILKTICFTVGDGDVIQALDLSVTLMETGEVCEIKTGPRFAFGDLGRAPDIPGNVVLLYEVELLEVLEPLDYQSLSQQELLDAVDKKRVRGNELFTRREYDRAITSYQKGIQMLQSYSEEHGGKENEDIKEMEIRCWNNVAAAQLKVELYKEVLVSCDHVLTKDPNNIKALYRSGKVFIHRGDLDYAVRVLQKAASLSPEEKAIQQELGRAIRTRDNMIEKERAMYKRMMEGKPVSTSSKTKSKAETTSSWKNGPLPYLTAAMVVAAIGIGLAYFITQRH